MSISTGNSAPAVSMTERHAALAQQYAAAPKRSCVSDSANSSSSHDNLRDPLHSQVTMAGHTVPVALHRAIGGLSDGPVPGDILCAALASCMESSLRVIANRMEIDLQRLEVHVSADVDVRGTLCLDKSVPVGFQSMHISVDLKAAEGTTEQSLAHLIKAAEHCCVVLQTLKAPPKISTQFAVTAIGDR